ncbi:hypothetical protein DSO57_1018981 [Entomophthora muscae]|uniref:Uncharacterized protein n=1 Tax=Entomophthora muscae TaxID=34485 RepID=A0ACC2UP93_9FUNG|nr:hypothetical protein DSO57_1018981 [Entomophthora muscae]
MEFSEELFIALKSGIYVARTVPELMCHLGSFKEQFKNPFLDYNKYTSFSSNKPKGKSWDRDSLKKSTTIAIPSINNTANSCTCYKCGQLVYISWDCKQPKANVRHLGQEDSKEDKQEDKTRKEKKMVEDKPLTASSNQPSPHIDPDPNIPDCDNCLLDQETCPKRYLQDKEEINEDLLHRVLAVNVVTRKQAIFTESLPSQEAIDTVSIPYTEQLSMPYTEATHKSDSVQKLSQLLKLVQVSTNLDTLKSLLGILTKQ